MDRNDMDKVVSLKRLKVACRACSLAQLCLPVGASRDDIERLDAIIKRRRPLRRGEHLYRTGDRFHSVYLVRSGSIKSCVPTDRGQEQVTGFHLPGELVGLDAIHVEEHHCGAVALETTSMCEVPFPQLESLAGQVPGLQRQMHRLMSREVLRDHEHLLMLGKRNAEERLVTFLITLSNRFHERGYSAVEFRLSMSRGDIGNYLGLAVETVSRLFTRLQGQGCISVDRKLVQLREPERLRMLAGVRPLEPDPRSYHGQRS
ncbi:transcriptional activator protein Anr [bacterium BMS3Bbin12]|nr:transcriptional activator protein Anr [bacterium BMS3Abin12]GBE47100.1 transcriptional activator protein Anr [bacterium BMS3Bbin12]GBE51355.1 transcriptional activator protein Anr [bacterium BMS3Bbin13]